MCWPCGSRGMNGWIDGGAGERRERVGMNIDHVSWGVLRVCLSVYEMGRIIIYTERDAVNKYIVYT